MAQTPQNVRMVSYLHDRPQTLDSSQDADFWGNPKREMESYQILCQCIFSRAGGGEGEGEGAMMLAIDVQTLGAV